jgi:hypothetical protein
MMKNNKLSVYYILLLALVILFIIFKIPYLSLPYYWDEAWVYGPAIRIMEAHKLSLLPDALPVYYSRGHPLLFHFLGALWMRVFGTSLTASHLFALSISIALLVFVFVFCKNLFNKETGLIACLFLVLQPIFQAQSVLLLPEVMVSLFSLMTLYYFIKEKWGWYMLSATLVLYTKETGIVAVGTVGLWFLLEVFFLKRSEFSIYKIQVPNSKPKIPKKTLGAWGLRLKTWVLLRSPMLKYFILRSLILIVPLLLIGVFLLIQKKMNGWYFFPEHVNYITNDKSGFASKLLAYSTSMFVYWGRNVLSAALIVSLFLYFFLKKHIIVTPKAQFSDVSAPALKGEHQKIRLPELVPTTEGGIGGKANFHSNVEKTFNPANKPILILSIYIVLFLIASSFNFFSDRYTMSMMAPFMIIVAYMVFTTFTFSSGKSQDSKSNVMLRSETSRSMAYDSPTSRRGIASPQCDKASWGLKLKKWGFLYAFIIAVCVVQLFMNLPTRTSSDHNLGYADCVQVQQQTVDFCVENHFQDKKIFTEFLMMGNLGNPYCGYLSEDEKFRDVSSHFDANTQLCIFYNMEGADDYKQIKASAKLQLLKRFELRQAWTEVYKVEK